VIKNTVASFIQATPKRLYAAERLAKWIEKYDLNKSTTLIQGPGVNAWDHFFNVMEAMCACDAEWVIRFEDDAIIGPNIRHNVLTWPEAKRNRFGVGWLYSAPASIIDVIYEARTEPRHQNKWLEGCVAVLFKRDVLRDNLLPYIRKWAEKNPAGYCYDYAISAGVKNAGYEIWRHNPPIVEHDSTIKSSFNHTILPEHCTMGAFRKNFKRPGATPEEEP